MSHTHVEPEWGAILGLLILLASTLVTCAFLAAVVWLLGSARLGAAVLVITGLLLMAWCFWQLERVP